ncbi:hypothetical protein AGMMS49546_39300 [Spirochaetia bacterium]|nr:hypothetical protein AGMMS49546_39300 [Spirochaetia bacterium]
MVSYPDILLSRSAYPPIGAKEVVDYFFIRKTDKDLYQKLKEGFELEELVNLIIPEGTTERDIFELSVFLYGYFDVKHLDFRVSEKPYKDYYTHGMEAYSASDIVFSMEPAFPVFLFAEKLYERSLEVKALNEFITHSFEHKPTRCNYWHFQLFAEDDQQKRIPREEANKGKRKRNKIRAQFLLEHITEKAVCKELSELVPFRRDDFDTLIAPGPVVYLP